MKDYAEIVLALYDRIWTSKDLPDLAFRDRVAIAREQAKLIMGDEAQIIEEDRRKKESILQGLIEQVKATRGPSGDA